MKTYEDLLQVGESEKNKGAFCYNAVVNFMSTTDYQAAVDAEKYYNKHNTTIERFQKFLYTVTGRQVKDTFSANYKLKTTFFRREVIQIAQYMLGNGVSFDQEGVKEKLGYDFDSKLVKALKLAMVGGRSFGYWNNDHLEVFGYAATDKHAGFCPLYSDDTAELMAGIRFQFKTVGEKTVARYTLFEPDGVTEYRSIGHDKIEVVEPKHGYKTVIARTSAEGVVSVYEEDYNGVLPIVPLYSNDAYESELTGHKEQIDAYDLMKSGLCNSIDDASEVFWLIQNAGGMDDIDLAQFLQRLKTTHAAVIDSSVGGNVTANTINVPADARLRTLEMLRSDIYEDMMIVDMKSLSAAQKTTQEIQSAYQSQDNKCDDIEYFLFDFVKRILSLAGINATPTFNRSKVVNENEMTTMVLSAANYVSHESIIHHLPWLTSDEQEMEIKRFENEQIARFMVNEDLPDTQEEKEGVDEE